MVIVSLTTWKKRINNIPAVLDSIFGQTAPPDLVVLNLANEEELPATVEKYIMGHNVEIIRVPDTKVYKKILPTLLKYKDATIICIDDDWIYPSNMIADFLEVHKNHPDMPVTGNYVVYNHLNCHCGCASLVKYEYFGDYLEQIDEDVIKNCPSDDMLFTYFAARTGHYYCRTQGTYFLNMEPFGANDSYSANYSHPEDATWTYLTGRFGPIRCYTDFNFVKMIVKRWVEVATSYLHK